MKAQEEPFLRDPSFWAPRDARRAERSAESSKLLLVVSAQLEEVGGDVGGIAQLRNIRRDNRKEEREREREGERER